MQYDFYSWQSLPLPFMHWVRVKPQLGFEPRSEDWEADYLPTELSLLLTTFLLSAQGIEPRPPAWMESALTTWPHSYQFTLLVTLLCKYLRIVNTVYWALFNGVKFSLFWLSSFNSENFYTSKYLFYIEIYQ